MMARRAGNRRAAARRILRRTVRVAGVVLLLGALGGLGYYLSRYVETGDDFLIQVIRIEGLNRVSEHEAVSASGLKSGDNIMQVDRLDLANRIEEIPFVKTAHVTIVFPDTVVIRVREREPYASLVYRNDAYELDRDGVVLRKLPRNSVPLSPMITELGDVGGVEVGAPIAAGTPLHEAFAAWEAFRTTSAFEALTLSEIAAPDADAIRMYFNEVPYELRWGRGDPVQQARRFDLLWKERDGRLGCAEYLDLRFGDDIVCK